MANLPGKGRLATCPAGQKEMHKNNRNLSMQNPHNARPILEACAPCILTLIIFFTIQAALAGENCQLDNCVQPCFGSSAILCCSDCYCRKPMPCMPCLCTGFCPDDYCRKPLPCMPCLRTCFCPDDYCRKPLPCVCLPPLTGKRECAGRGCGK
jgi:hypothetical protein